MIEGDVCNRCKNVISKACFICNQLIQINEFYCYDGVHICGQCAYQITHERNH